jgi:hypothetical protein
MSPQECATALDQIQRRAVRHTNTGGPIQNLAAPRDAATMKALGYYVPELQPDHWTRALAAADAALAEPRPERSHYSRGEFGTDQYELALDGWEARQRKARRLKALAEKRLAGSVAGGAR